MKTEEELKSLYENTLKDKLQSLEAQRKGIMLRYVFYILGIIASIGATFLSGPQTAYMFQIGLVGMVIFIILLIRMKKSKEAYRQEFKQNVVKEIVQLINPQWNYQPDGRISETDYRMSDLFPSSYDRYRGDDLVSGVIERTDFKFSELHTEYKTTSTDGDGHTKTEWHTIFKGIFAHADFNKEIQGRTLVLPDTAEKLFGSFGKKLQKMSGRGKLIKMENVEFEKQFVVYGSDQIESRYILTPSMMESMMNIKKKYKKPIYFSFKGSRVYVAMSFSQDLFEPRIFKSGVNFDDMRQMNEQFSVIQSIVQEMNLNTRIWTKD